MAYGDDIIQGGWTAFNPNTITDTSTQGPGSGNGVQSAQQKQQYGAQANMDWSQDPLGILQSAFPEVPIDVLSKYAFGITGIDKQLYQLGDPNSLLYQQFYDEESGFLGDAYGARRRQGIFENIGATGERIGQAGGRGMLSGRDYIGQQSKATDMYGRSLGQEFGKGLYDIKTDIMDRAWQQKQWLVSQEGQRRDALLRLAEMGEFLTTKTENEQNNFFNSGSFEEVGTGTWEYNPE